MRIILDTHAAIWAADDDPRLGPRAREQLRGCVPGEAAISDVTLPETSLLIRKGRLRLSIPTTHYLRNLQSHFRVLPIDAAIAAEAFEIDLPQGDSFDRVIVATARHHRASLLTRDAAITESGLLEVVW